MSILPFPEVLDDLADKLPVTLGDIGVEARHTGRGEEAGDLLLDLLRPVSCDRQFP